jgi:hypothetical protein
VLSAALIVSLITSLGLLVFGMKKLMSQPGQFSQSKLMSSGDLSANDVDVEISNEEKKTPIAI